jgi:HEAT repeat protein
MTSGVATEETSVRIWRMRLEHGEATAADAVLHLAEAALGAPTRTARLEACRLLGDLAGRALGAEWDVAERAAFALLEAARIADTAADRRGVLAAMGRGFRNIWLLPFVHRRLSDRDLTIAAAALQAAGGLGFPALEESVAAFVTEAAPPALRRAAITSLGRMGAMSAVDRLVPLILGDPTEAAAALTALTEIRSPAGRDAALVVLDHDLEPEVQIAAVRYLAELGALEVVTVLRRLARHDDAEIRIASNLASRALEAERDRDPAERFLIALGEPDRAVRAVLARRLRTLPVAEVIEQAEVLLADDAAGVVQILGELRDPEITRYLLAVADRAALPAVVRARAVGAIEADQPWERAALAALAHRADADEGLRAAAVQAMGAFASSLELIDRIGGLATSPSSAIRGAVLWALQLAARSTNDAAPIARLVAPMLDDEDPLVRRRAAYATGNLGLSELAATLVKRCAASEPSDLRLAAYVALGELGMPGVIAEVVAAVKREDDPRVLGAASNALLAAAPDAKALTGLAPRATQLLTAAEARLREAGAEIAGLLGGAVPAPAIAPLVADDAPSVRGAAVWALGKLADPSTEAALLAAFRDDDPAVHERAAAGLLRLGTPAALAQAIAFVAGDGDPTARGAVAAAITISRHHAADLAPAIDAALRRVDADDPAFEPLLRMKLASAVHDGEAAPPIDVDAEITAAFPSFAQMSRLSGFDAMIRSLRTAESLFQTTGGSHDADLSPPITLWMKVLENYVHAWLGPRLAGLQREPAALFDYVDRVIGASWPGFQRWLEPKWRDPSEVGTAKVEIPLRAIPNAVRELQEHRRKRLDSPLSVTEWARLMVLFAVDHPSGFKNLMKLGGKSAERTVSLAHRLHTLAAVRNLVTHRASAGAATLAAFRRSYYAAFEDLVALA